MWIDTVPVDKAEGRLETLYRRVKAPDGTVDNIMMAHSLRPHSMEGHMALYKAVLHHYGNALPKALLETIGVYVSLLNGCAYCVEHHFAGLKRLMKGDNRADGLRAAMAADTITSDAGFSDREVAALIYARALTKDPAAMSVGHVQALRDVGFDDGEILEINQVTAYFSYANRTVLGLGVTTDGDILGLSPGDSDDPENWNHS